MPVIKSAIKRVKQQERRAVSNIRVKRELRDSVKKLEVAIDSKNLEQTEAALSRVYSVLDKTVKKHIYHKNKAARKKAAYAAAAKEVIGKTSKKKRPVKKTAGAKSGSTKKKTPTTKKSN